MATRTLGTIVHTKTYKGGRLAFDIDTRVGHGAKGGPTKIDERLDLASAFYPTAHESIRGLKCWDCLATFGEIGYLREKPRKK